MLEYVNSSPEVADAVVQGMNRLEIAGNKLSVQRVPQSSAALLLKPTQPAPQSVASIKVPVDLVVENKSDESSKIGSPTAVVRLSNMVTTEDLTDEAMYDELVEDVSDECNSYATVRSVHIPKLGQDGVGMIFVHFTDTVSDLIQSYTL